MHDFRDGRSAIRGFRNDVGRSSSRLRTFLEAQMYLVSLRHISYTPAARIGDADLACSRPAAHSCRLLCTSCWAGVATSFYSSGKAYGAREHEEKRVVVTADLCDGVKLKVGRR